jgi:hypothetical protein
MASNDKTPANSQPSSTYKFGLEHLDYSFGVSHPTVSPAPNTAPPAAATQTNSSPKSPVVEQSANVLDAANYHAEFARRSQQPEEMNGATEEETPEAEVSPLQKFSRDFKLYPTIMSIVKKIDGDGDGRLSKKELYASIAKRRFLDDEELTAGLLLTHFDYIRSAKNSGTSYLDARGMSVNEILAYPWHKYVPLESLPGSVQASLKQQRKIDKRTR